MIRRALFILVAGLLAALPLKAAEQTPAVGEMFPELRPSVPENPDHRNYLGLSGRQSFTVGDIDAEVVVIEIFNMYCPHCQREAPNINAFYQRVEQSPRLRGRVKVIGIGVGNSPFEVDHFRKTYEVPFPLFPDPDYSIHQALGEVRTPYFFGVKPDAGGGARVFFSRLGGSRSAERILEELIRQSGLLSEGGSP
jgi:thiol-disulfide isomerase/thioredoxin